ncbi:MAG: hypothetical protein C4523_15210 [Myxococcales bacterium]|nr:MAG: hypothetical protein C4523_15210 [Myxococcales bacterium]
MKRAHGTAVALAALAVASAGVQATTVKRMSLPDMAKYSKWVVEGTVVANQVVYEQGADGPLNIRTITTIQVARSFKGDAPKTLSVTGWGGVVGEISHNWPGVPRFKEGENAILFLYEDPRGELQVTGLEQGRMTIQDRPGLGKVVSQSLEGLNFEGDSRSIHAPGPRSLDSVLKEIKDVVAAQPADAEENN